MKKEQYIKNADQEIEIGKEVAVWVAKFGLKLNRKLTKYEKEILKKELEETADAAEILTKFIARFSACFIDEHKEAK